MSQASSEEFNLQVGRTLCQGTLKIPDGGPLSIVCSNKPLHRDIKISVTGNNKVLTLCEVKVFLNLQAESVNLALNKLAKQSSTRNVPNSGCNLASCAVDGNRNNDFLVGKSCTHTKSEGEDNPWWRVDLGTVQPVSRVYVVNRKYYGFLLSDFELRIGNSEVNGDMSNPKCGDKYSVPGAQALNIYCNPPMFGRYVYIRIPGKNKVLVMCEVEVYSDGNACTNQAIGTSNNSSFQDNSWTASSSQTGNEPYKARLDGVGIWTPATNSGVDYLQIDLGAVYVICAVATQGNSNKDEWTKTYKIKISVNKDDWNNYKEGNFDKVLTGNADRNSIVKYNLVGLNQARFVRFVPVEYNGRKALRVEIYGVLQGVLAAPTDLTFTNIQSRSVTVHWTNSDDDPVLGSATSNKIQYSSGGTTKDITTQSLTTSQSVTGLIPYTEYKVKVLVVNKVGQGLWSAEENFATDSDVPEEAPNLTTVTALTSQSVNVTWQKPDKINGELVGYKVLYRKTGQSSFITETLTGSVTSHNLNCLAKETEYEVKVQVYNSKGDSPASDVKTVRTLEDAGEWEKFGQKDAVFSSPVFWAVGGTLLFMVLVLIIAVACLILKLKRIHASNKKCEETRISNDSPHNPSDTRTYMGLQPSVQAYQSLGSSSAVRPKETYEEVPMPYVNVNSEEYEEVRSTNA